MSVAAVVLAAGGGSRFSDGHKLLAPLGGVPLVLWAVRAALGAGLDETVVVSGSVDLSGVVPEGVTLIEHPGWSSGQATSLRVALDWCSRRGHDAVVVGLADAPLIPSSAWRDVAVTPGELVVATFSGQRHPPVKIARARWDEVPSEGDEGARALLRKDPSVVEVPCEGRALDVDTVSDLANLAGCPEALPTGPP